MRDRSEARTITPLISDVLHVCKSDQTSCVTEDYFYIKDARKFIYLTKGKI